jgi:hypothetical protein
VGHAKWRDYHAKSVDGLAASNDPAEDIDPLDRLSLGDWMRCAIAQFEINQETDELKPTGQMASAIIPVSRTTD